jgi:hypothetical protein
MENFQLHKKRASTLRMSFHRVDRRRALALPLMVPHCVVWLRAMMKRLHDDFIPSTSINKVM